MALALGCGDDPVDPPPTPVPTTITISPAAATSVARGNGPLTAAVQDQTGRIMTLTADTTAIADDKGLGTFSYQWIRGSTDISGATSKTCVPVAA